MSAIFCPNCGKKHTINNKFCEYCGTNLGDAILRYKQKHLPIKYQQGTTPKPYLQESTRGIEKRPRKKVVTITSILLLIFLILAIITISIASYLRIT
ncbi:MAG: zinc ribbon domain-containing protein, partial [Candidatus Heimdallarchaeota archaeon]|nr:zinc ribbon domain-containing protein [Candidatus Heimdallarchaeota archaeon]